MSFPKETVSGTAEQIRTVYRNRPRVHYLQFLQYEKQRHRFVMDISVNMISFVSVLLACFLVVRVMKPESFSEALIFAFPVVTGIICLGGYLLSFLNKLNNNGWWAGVGVFVFLLSLAFIFYQKKYRATYYNRIPLPQKRELKEWLGSMNQFQKIILSILCAAFILSSALNLYVALSTAPSNWDSMTYHLARVAYYYQHGNFNYFDANYWAQVIHPKNSAILLLYALVVSGLQESATKLVQFFCYLVSIVAIYGISRRLGYRKTGSVFAALIFSLLIEALMEATTTQNDMMITACIGVIIYGMLSLSQSKTLKYSLLIGVSIGIAAGMKSSFLLIIPSLIVLGIFLLAKKLISRRSVMHCALFCLLGVTVFSVPAGYAENYKIFGDPFGPEFVQQMHTFKGKDPNYVVNHGTKNVVRFFLDGISLDGLPRLPSVLIAQSVCRQIPLAIVQVLGADVESKEDVRYSFTYDREPRADEDYSGFGILGFGFIWITVLVHLLRFKKKSFEFALALSAILFVVFQAYSGPYDPWRGRYFIALAPFATPLVSSLFQDNNLALFKVYLTLIVVLGSICAVSAIVFRDTSPVLSVQRNGFSTRSVFSMNRIEQLARNRLYYWYKPLKIFEDTVPPNAVVALCQGADKFEYPFFGEKFSRKIIPINSFVKKMQPIPPEADYVYFAKQYIKPKETDIFLGDVFYLRKLK